MNSAGGKRLLLLCTTTGYQTRAFIEAGEKLGLPLVFGTDRCHVLEDPWQDGALPLRFEDPGNSARQIVEYARSHPVDAIIALGDRPTPTAARACRALGLPHHPPEAADACRDKYHSRERLRAAGLSVPSFERFPLTADPREIIASSASVAALYERRSDGHRPPLEEKALGVEFPCVLKPLALSASRGVIRANDPEQFVSAFERIRDLLSTPEVRVMREETSDFIQVETYIEGQEVAIEALVDRGQLKILAIFDKPDPLVGPFFEETIYVTPSRLRSEAQIAVSNTLEQAVQALGLFHGPVHAEFRIHADAMRPEGTRTHGIWPDPMPPDHMASDGVWILEVAARSIGGLCSRALRFCSPSLGENISLEELIIRLALGMDVQTIGREAAASGVMMIPIPEAGIFQDVKGVEQALETPGVKDIRITAKPTQKLLPLPEGSSYLGFIFARGPSAQFVEHALRSAHQELRFVITPALPLI